MKTCQESLQSEKTGEQSGTTEPDMHCYDAPYLYKAQKMAYV